jgi:hypothetical protein
MPQLMLKLSNNINITKLDFKSVFSAIHERLGKVPKLDNRTCFSGVIHEEYSYIGLGDDKLCKIFLEIMWLETEERIALKAALAADLMSILTIHLADSIQEQALIFQPRVRIVNLGMLGQEYHIY